MQTEKLPFRYSLYAVEQLFDLYATIASKHRHIEVLKIKHRNGCLVDGRQEKTKVSGVIKVIKYAQKRLTSWHKQDKRFPSVKLYYAISSKKVNDEYMVDGIVIFAGYNTLLSPEDPSHFLFFHLLNSQLREDIIEKFNVDFHLYFRAKKENILFPEENTLTAIIRIFADVTFRPVYDEKEKRGDRQYYAFSRRTHQLEMLEEYVILRKFFNPNEIGDDEFRTQKRTHKPRKEYPGKYHDKPMLAFLGRSHLLKQ